jgi:hypothetical protein
MALINRRNTYHTIFSFLHMPDFTFSGVEAVNGLRINPAINYRGYKHATEVTLWPVIHRSVDTYCYVYRYNGKIFELDNVGLFIVGGFFMEKHNLNYSISHLWENKDAGFFTKFREGVVGSFVNAVRDDPAMNAATMSLLSSVLKLTFGENNTGFVNNMVNALSSIQQMLINGKVIYPEKEIAIYNGVKFKQDTYKVEKIYVTTNTGDDPYSRLEQDLRVLDLYPSFYYPSRLSKEILDKCKNYATYGECLCAMKSNGDLAVQEQYQRMILDVTKGIFNYLMCLCGTLYESYGSRTNFSTLSEKIYKNDNTTKVEMKTKDFDLYFEGGDPNLARRKGLIVFSLDYIENPTYGLKLEVNVFEQKGRESSKRETTKEEFIPIPEIQIADSIIKELGASVVEDGEKFIVTIPSITIQNKVLAEIFPRHALDLKYDFIDYTKDMATRLGREAKEVIGEVAKDISEGDFLEAFGKSAGYLASKVSPLPDDRLFNDFVSMGKKLINLFKIQLDYHRTFYKDVLKELQLMLQYVSVDIKSGSEQNGSTVKTFVFTLPEYFMLNNLNKKINVPPTFYKPDIHVLKMVGVETGNEVFSDTITNKEKVISVQEEARKLFDKYVLTSRGGFMKFSIIRNTAHNSCKDFITSKISKYTLRTDGQEGGAEGALGTALAFLRLLLVMPPNDYHFIPYFKEYAIALYNNSPSVTINDVKYYISYYGIVFLNLNRASINWLKDPDKAGLVQSINYLIPHDIDVQVSDAHVYPRESNSVYRIYNDSSMKGIPLYIKLSIVFKPFNEYIHLFGNFIGFDKLLEYLGETPDKKNTESASSTTASDTSNTTASLNNNDNIQATPPPNYSC